MRANRETAVREQYIGRLFESARIVDAGHQARRRVAAQPARVAQQVVHADRRANDEQQPADRLAGRQRQPGDVLRDQHRERVEGGARIADAGADIHDADRHDRIHAQRQTERDQDRDERHVLLGHSDGGRAEGEQQHHAGDEQARPRTEPAQCGADQRVHRAGGPHEADHPAGDEDEEDDVLGRRQTGRDGGEERQRRQRIGLDGMVGAADDLASFALELAGRQHVGGELRQHDKQEDEDE